MFQPTIGAIFREARELRRFTLRHAGKESKISYRSIHHYETDHREPCFSYAVILCDLYEIEIETLVDLVLRRLRVSSKSKMHKTNHNRKRISSQHFKMGDLFREAREDMELTTREVSAETLIDHASMSRYENNRQEPGLSAAIILCNFYGIGVAALAGIVRQNYKAELMAREAGKTPLPRKKLWCLREK